MADCDLDAMLDDAFDDLEPSAAAAAPAPAAPLPVAAPAPTAAAAAATGGMATEEDLDAMLEDDDLDAMLDDAACALPPAPAAAPVAAAAAAAEPATRRKVAMPELDAVLPPELAARWRKTILGDGRTQAGQGKQRPLSRSYKSFVDASDKDTAGAKEEGGGGEGGVAALASRKLPPNQKLFAKLLQKSLTAANSSLSANKVLCRTGDGAIADAKA